MIQEELVGTKLAGFGGSLAIFQGLIETHVAFIQIEARASISYE